VPRRSAIGSEYPRNDGSETDKEVLSDEQQSFTEHVPIVRSRQVAVF
jgi:hypothetical protein